MAAGIVGERPNNTEVRLGYSFEKFVRSHFPRRKIKAGFLCASELRTIYCGCVPLIPLPRAEHHPDRLQVEKIAIKVQLVIDWLQSASRPLLLPRL